ncbi:hypothetical protein [Nodosilinea sp. FACHB-13]|uniref:hypothetical protein n=1 Tax=Cyanophyceae TaxID=3028117 RepID=UPI0016872E44|nr:hypothetical protein [Nodosilinea sp. FACHB-13]MBD2106248.1 hypothetical protein [Nodosilinea sp. FACHB-13]
MPEQFDPLKFLEQLSPSEKLIGIVLVSLLFLLPSILEKFSSENLKLIVLVLFTGLILSIAWLATYKNKKIENDRKLKISFENKLRALRDREAELMGEEQKNLTEVIQRLRFISNQVTTCLERSNKNLSEREEVATLKPVVLDVQKQVRQIIVKLEVKLQTSDNRINDLMGAKTLFEKSDEIAKAIISSKELK